MADDGACVGLVAGIHMPWGPCKDWTGMGANCEDAGATQAKELAQSQTLASWVHQVSSSGPPGAGTCAGAPPNAGTAVPKKHKPRPSSGAR